MYGVKIDVPQSTFNDTPLWNNSIIGELYNKTNGGFWIKTTEHVAAPYIYRVTNVELSDEDGVMSYFRVYDEYGNGIVYPTIGIHGAPGNHQIGGGFKYPPNYGNQYYIPINGMPTYEGYIAEVLDTETPSEGCHFTLIKSGKQHQGSIITWRKFLNNGDYPGGFELPQDI
jgi:hypothetical protein